MTVKELMAWLQTQPEDARVFEDRDSELRELQLVNLDDDSSADGHPIDEGEYDEDEWEELMSTPIVIFGAWS